MTNNNTKSLNAKIWMTAVCGLFAAPTPLVFGSGTNICSADYCYLIANLPPELNATTIGGPGSESLLEYHQGEWKVDGQTVAYLGFAGWKPVVGDWDGDGYDNIGVYSNGFWMLKNNWLIGELGDATSANLGSANSEPVVGNWDGSNQSSIGVYNDGEFTLRMNMDDANADVTIDFGDLPFDPADADGPRPTVAEFSTTRIPYAQVGVVLNDTLKFSVKNVSRSYDFHAGSTGQLGLDTRVLDHYTPDWFPITISSNGLSIPDLTGDGIAYFPRPHTPSDGSDTCSINGATDVTCLAITIYQPLNPDTGITMPIPIGGPRPQ